MTTTYPTLQSQYVPIRMNAYVPTPTVNNPSIVYVPEETVHPLGISEQYQISSGTPSSHLTVKTQSSSDPQNLLPSTKLNAEWKKYHRQKPVWVQENRKDYPIKVFKVPDRWVTEQKDNYVYYTANSSMNQEAYERYIKQKEIEEAKSAKPAVNVQAAIQPSTSLNRSTLRRESIVQEDPIPEPEMAISPNPTTSTSKAQSHPGERQEDEFQIPKFKQPLQSLVDTTAGSKQPASGRSQPAASPRTSRSERPQTPQLDRPHTPRSNYGSAPSTPRSAKGQKSIFRRPSVDHGYIHVPSKQNIITETQVTTEQVDPYAYDPNKKTKQLKQYEKFIETRKKIKKQQEKNEQYRNKYVDEYYRQQDEAKQNTYLTDSENLDRYLPPEGRPPFHNYGWGNQNPVSEDNRMKSYNVNPRDVHDVIPGVISRRERTATYEGWKRFLESSIGYRKYRPTSFYNKEFKRFDGKSIDSTKNQTSSQLKDIMTGKPVSDVERGTRKKHYVPVTTPENKEVVQAIAESTNATTTRSATQDQAFNQQIGVPTPRSGGASVSLTSPGETIPQPAPVRTQAPVLNQSQVYIQQQQQQQHQPIQQVSGEPPVIYVPTTSKTGISNVMSSQKVESQGSSKDEPIVVSRRHSVGATPQFVRYDYGQVYVDDNGQPYVFAPNKDGNAHKLFLDMHKQPIRHFEPSDHKELNPKYYRTLPPVYTHYIRPAGKPTAHTLTTADCFGYFE